MNSTENNVRTFIVLTKKHPTGREYVMTGRVARSYGGVNDIVELSAVEGGKIIWVPYNALYEVSKK